MKMNELTGYFLDKIIEKYMSTDESFHALSKKTGISKETLMRVVNDEHPKVQDKTWDKFEQWVDGEFD